MLAQRHATGAHIKRCELQFTCLVPPDPSNERMALEFKRQLAAVGVEMRVQETVRGSDHSSALQESGVRGVLIEGVSGPTLLRPY